MTLTGNVPSQPVDVAIHCGDLTEESKLDEFRATLKLLHAIEAPLKFVIAGNHDFTLDATSFKKKVEEATRRELESELIFTTYGEYEEARRLLLDAEKDGIYFLDEGTHRFILRNGAELAIFASPFTPSLGEWGFQYHPDQGHIFNIEEGTDIVVAHGPPRGILDRTNSRERSGCPDLFGSIAKAKPQVHCFGHIHESWGAKMVTWREILSEKPSHLTDIDNDKSFIIEQLSTLQEGKFDTPEDVKAKQEKVNKYAEHKFCHTSHCHGDKAALDIGKQTLFVNASIKGDEDMPIQPPWLVELDLRKAVVNDKSIDAGGVERATVGKKRTINEEIASVEEPSPKQKRPRGEV